MVKALHETPQEGEGNFILGRDGKSIDVESFLAFIGHELRAPLTAILGSSELLAKEIEMTPALRQEIADGLVNGAHRLERLLNDLLDVERHGPSILEAKREPIDIGELVEGALRLAPIRAARRLDVDVPHLVAEIDPTKVDRIIENLVINAHKYSPSDELVSVRVRTEPGGLHIQVDDRGPGIPDGHKEQIFEIRYRNGNGEPGDGIGLAVVKTFAEAHGGRAWVEDRPGGGASFNVFLPAKIHKAA